MSLDAMLKLREDFLKKQEQELAKFDLEWAETVYQTTGIRPSQHLLNRREAYQIATQVPTRSKAFREEQLVEPGIYRGPVGLRARVIFQNFATSMVTLELLGSDYEHNHQQHVTPELFKRLFDLEEDTVRAEDPAHVEFVVGEWRASQDWPQVIVQLDNLMEHARALSRAIRRQDQELSQSEVIEFLFMTYVLAGRLGLPIDNDFQDLHKAVFANVDRTESDAKLTELAYREQGLQTYYQEIKLYHGMEPLRPPVRYYITVSATKQEGLHGPIPAGSFLPAYRQKAEYLLSVRKDS